jgi:hypothetical protein
MPLLDFIKNILRVTYSPRKIRSTITHHMHAPMQYFQNALTYFATAIRYACKCLLNRQYYKTFFFFSTGLHFLSNICEVSGTLKTVHSISINYKIAPKIS